VRGLLIKKMELNTQRLWEELLICANAGCASCTQVCEVVMRLHSKREVRLHYLQEALHGRPTPEIQRATQLPCRTCGD
jgi:hypothetical protein